MKFVPTTQILNELLSREKLEEALIKKKRFYTVLL